MVLMPTTPPAAAGRWEHQRRSRRRSELIDHVGPDRDAKGGRSPPFPSVEFLTRVDWIGPVPIGDIMTQGVARAS